MNEAGDLVSDEYDDEDYYDDESSMNSEEYERDTGFSNLLFMMLVDRGQEWARLNRRRNNIEDLRLHLYQSVNPNLIWEPYRH